jgi:hypothetical protein
MPIVKAMLGGVTITNNLRIPLYLWSVDNTQGPMRTLPASGGNYSETWRLNPAGGGISIKLATVPALSDVVQFEYTYVPSELRVYWDVSCINMSNASQIMTGGFSVTADSQSSPSVICNLKDMTCPDVYFHPDDNYAVRASAGDTLLTMNIGLPLQK